jgi:hypothetical protein
VKRAHHEGLRHVRFAEDDGAKSLENVDEDAVPLGWPSSERREA